MFGGNALANLVVNILVNSRGFHQQLLGIRGQLNQTSVAAQKTRAFFILSGAAYAAGTFIKKLGEIETAFIRIERVAKEFKGPEFRGKIFDLAQEISGSSLTDIQKIMKISAQLGVRGRENILEFSRSMAMLSNVTGLSADTITTDIGKVIQVFNLLPTNAERVSNTILQVADDFNVVETEITNIVRRIGAFSNSIGLSVEETIAFAATMKDIGVNTEIAASSLYTFFARLQTEPIALAKFFGMAKEELFDFFLLLRQNPKQGILNLLGRIREMPPGERLAFFEKLELYGVRNAAALGTLAEKVDRLDIALESANKGSEENIRLMEGQWARMNSIDGKIDDMSDAWSRFTDTLGNTAFIQRTLSVYTEFFNEIERRIREASGAQYTSVNLSDPKTIEKRIKELRETIRGADLIRNKQQGILDKGIHWMPFPGAGIQIKPPAWFSKLFGESHESLGNVVGINQAKKELSFLETFLKKLTDKVEGPIKAPTPPTEDAVRKEFIGLLKREDEKNRKQDLFKGFMGLTEAWKNLFLDKNKNSELRALNDIHEEAVEHNNKLDDLIGAVENIRVGAILG